MCLLPFGLHCSACFGSLFVSILCTCCSHFFWYCFISFTIFCAPVFCLIHWYISLSSFVIQSKCLKNFICAASKRCCKLIKGHKLNTFLIQKTLWLLEAIFAQLATRTPKWETHFKNILTWFIFSSALLDFVFVRRFFERTTSGREICGILLDYSSSPPCPSTSPVLTLPKFLNFCISIYIFYCYIMQFVELFNYYTNHYTYINFINFIYIYVLCFPRVFLFRDLFCMLRILYSLICIPFFLLSLNSSTCFLPHPPPILV